MRNVPCREPSLHSSHSSWLDSIICFIFISRLETIFLIISYKIISTMKWYLYLVRVCQFFIISVEIDLMPMSRVQIHTNGFSFDQRILLVMTTGELSVLLRHMTEVVFVICGVTFHCWDMTWFRTSLKETISLKNRTIFSWVWRGSWPHIY